MEWGNSDVPNTQFDFLPGVVVGWGILEVRKCENCNCDSVLNVDFDLFLCLNKKNSLWCDPVHVYLGVSAFCIAALMPCELAC